MMPTLLWLIADEYSEGIVVVLQKIVIISVVQKNYEYDSRAYDCSGE